MKPFPRLPRVEILIIGGACVMAFIVTLAVVSSSGNARARRSVATDLQAATRAQKPAALGPDELALTPEDFMLPPLPQAAEREPRYVPFRPQQTQWSAATVEKYWIPPRQITLDILQAANDRNLKRLFERVQ